MIDTALRDELASLYDQAMVVGDLEAVTEVLDIAIQDHELSEILMGIDATLHDEMFGRGRRN